MKTIVDSKSKNHVSSTHVSATHAGTTHASPAHHKAAQPTASPTPPSESSTESTSLTVTATAAPATTTTGSASTAASFLTPPPDVHSPSPPAGFETPAGTNFRSVVPRGVELTASSNAVQDLQRFQATYASVLGATAPPFDHFFAALSVASGWSSLRAESAAWDGYCATEEGLAWQAFRPMLDKFATAFQLAADSNRSLVSQYAGLATLIGARVQIANKAASTRKLNKKAVAEGQQPFHGAIGKKRQRKAEKAAMAQQQQQASLPQAGAPQVGAPQQAGVVVAPAGSGSGNAGGNGGTNGVNGAAHS